MLEIIVVKQVGEQLKASQVEMFRETQLSFIWENPLFQNDTIPAVFSLTFEVPGSPRNLQLFNYPNRITILQLQHSVKGYIRHSGLVIASGEFILVNFENFITLQFKGSIENTDQKTTLRQVEMGQTDFNVTYPNWTSGINNLDYSDAAWDDYKNFAINSSTSTDPEQQTVVAPVRLEGIQWDGHEAVRGVMNSVHKYINFYNPLNDRFSLDDPVKTHTPVMPFFRLHHVIANALGNTIENNPFEAADFNQIVIVGMNKELYNRQNLHYSFIEYAGIPYPNPFEVLLPVRTPTLDWWETGSFIWQHEKFMQNCKFNDFFKEILKIFGMTFYRGNVSQIKSKDDILDSNTVQNWDKMLDGFPVIEVEEEKDYLFEYQGETSDSDQEIEFNEYDDWNKVFTAAMLAQTNEEVSYKVADTPQIIKLTRTLRGRANQRWLRPAFQRSAMHTVHPRTRENNFTITSKVKPMNMSIEHYWWQNNLNESQIKENYLLSRKHWHVPVLPEMKSEDFPRIMFFAGRKGTFDEQLGENHGHQYPLLTNHNFDHFGNKLFDFSLLPSTTDGIIAKFHTKMKNWTEQNKMRVKGLFKLTPWEIKQIDMQGKVYLRGKLFFIERIQFTLTHNEISKTDATLIEYV